MMEFTKERLELFINKPLEYGLTRGEQMEMARQLLASMEQEPVAWRWRWSDDAEGCWRYTEENRETRGSVTAQPLYAAPQLPQPAVLSASEGVLKSLLPDVEKSEFWFEHNGKIFFEGVRFNNAVFEACRAAMLQGAEPVSQTYALRDGLEAIRKLGPIDAGKIQAERDALNEPVQGWIPCSERMPEEIGRYWCYVEEQNCLGKSHYQWNCSWNGGRWWVESENGGRVTHWMPLPSAPQQQVTP
ncbi:DUF551 domain-containing protein [Leclercia sp. W6]|uniref:DUF551 domain-containing protein n=1 Tax=Leclercia sp. W6 TaxID=2282310 RepID=UPI000DF48275|nr:DUF551 domain-containing protein [Leclercia sp. W6]AXF58191.1 DUF551 domain-containing protein [Leclercia sp. W6]